MIEEGTYVVDRRLAIPGCELVKEIGRGATGAVWFAQRDGRTCVVKVLRGDIGESEDLERRFIREARITSLLQHPNIAALLDAGRVSGRLYLVGEYVHGPTLGDLAWREAQRGRRLEPAFALGVVVQILDALSYAHDLEGPEGPLELVHRDLSWRNIMVGFDGRAKVIDFGVARALMGDGLTKTGAIFGTPEVMAPEQARGTAVDRRADLYALGVVLYQLLTDRSVVRDGSLLDQLDSIEKDVPPLVRTFAPQLPPAFDSILARVLAKTPDERFSTAAEFAEALRSSGIEPATPKTIAATLAAKYDAAERAPLTQTEPDNGPLTRAEVVVRPTKPARPIGAILLLATAMGVASVAVFAGLAPDDEQVERTSPVVIPRPETRMPSAAARHPAPAPGEPKTSLKMREGRRGATPTPTTSPTERPTADRKAMLRKALTLLRGESEAPEGLRKLTTDLVHAADRPVSDAELQRMSRELNSIEAELKRRVRPRPSERHSP